MVISTNLHVIAAICGNFWQESTINPGVWENLTVGDPGFGLGQWTDNPPIVERRTALFNWLDANGYSRDSGPGQLNFLVYENLWIPTTFVTSAYATLRDFFMSTSTNTAALTEEWMFHWEGINDSSYQDRLDAARYYYTEFLRDDGSRTSWWSGNYFLDKETTALENALLIKDFFMGIQPTPPPPPPSRRRDGLPPWFIKYLIN